MNLFLATLRNRAVGWKLDPVLLAGTPLPCALRGCLFSNPHLLAWLELFAFVFGSPMNGEVPLVCLVFFSLTSIGPDTYFILLIFRHSDYKVLLDKKKHPTLSSFWEIWIISVCSFVNFPGDGKSLYYRIITFSFLICLTMYVLESLIERVKIGGMGGVSR